MLRLFKQPGIRVATSRVARIQFRALTNGFGGEGVLLQQGEKQKATGNPRSEAKQNWVPKNSDRLRDHVNRLDDRVAVLSKDVGDFKGDVNKTLGELAARMGAGFGRIEGKMERGYRELKADIKPVVWHVSVLLGGLSLAVGFLVQTYLDERYTFTKRQAHAMPQAIPGPAAVAKKIGQKE